MDVGAPRWAEALKPSPESSSPVQALAGALTDGRLYREVALALRTGLRGAGAEFSFARVRGLKHLLAFLSSLPGSRKAMELFRHSQADSELQVVPTLFHYSLASFRTSSSLSSRGSIEMLSPPTDYEVALALRVLEGCCLIDSRSKIMASQYTTTKEFIKCLSTSGVLEQSACLDALLALILDMPMNQKEFICYHGLQKIADVMRNTQADERLRLKCAEFLILLSGRMLLSSPVGGDNAEQTADRVQEELLEHLGKKCGAIFNKESIDIRSPFDLENFYRLLHSQAKELLYPIELASHN